MAKIRHLTRVQKTDWSEQFPAADAELFRDMLDQWRMRGLSHNYGEKSIQRDQSTICDFVRFSGLPPWRWTEDIFERWCVHLVSDPKRNLAPSTLRSYQSAIRRFLDYLTSNAYFRLECERQFGHAVKQICNDQNCVVHRLANDARRPHRSFTHSEFAIFFDELDRQISQAMQFGSKNFRPLQRDKALYYLLYVCGLRISEALGLNTNSFLENMQFPEFQRYGRVEVYGKGSHGSGPRRRVVIVDHPSLPPILQWYEDEVRPHLLNRKNANEEAFFLSERGNRLGLGVVDARFKVLVRLANLHDSLTPHSLRRTSCTHGGMEMNSTIPQQHKLGHAHLGTTENYADYPDSWVRNQVRKAIKKRIAKSKHSTSSKEVQDGE